MNKEIPSQGPIWDKKHSTKEHEDLRHSPSPLSELAEPKFPRQSRILELGCGVGRDAELFASRGHSVIATDVSPIAITQDKESFPDSGVEFAVLDMSDPLPYQPQTFDVVYANLSLHYYSDADTRKIINEASKVLKPQGVFAFACKSYDDLHNSGQEVEQNVFVSESGVTIHLFTTDYARDLLDGLFEVEYLDEVDEEYNGRHSKIVRCISKKHNPGENQV